MSRNRAEDIGPGCLRPLDHIGKAMGTIPKEITAARLNSPTESLPIRQDQFKPIEQTTPPATQHPTPDTRHPTPDTRHDTGGFDEC